MTKSFITVVFAVLALNASAEVFKCKGSDGRTQFSDTPCRAGCASEIIPDRLPVTQQQRQEAQHRAMQMRSEEGTLEGSKTNTQPDNQALRQPLDPEPISSAVRSESNADPYANCVRDVERHGASQNVKAELIAACRTAGTTQGHKDTATDTVRECVRSVERTGASEAEKARQLTICHGGDVRPQFMPVPIQKAGSTRNE